MNAVRPIPTHAFPSSPGIARAMQWAPFVMTALLVLSALLFPEMAFAQDAKQKIADAGKKSFDLVFSVAYWICGIAVIVTGLGATFGDMQWSRFGKVVAGTVVVFCAELIINYFQ